MATALRRADALDACLNCLPCRMGDDRRYLADVWRGASCIMGFGASRIHCDGKQLAPMGVLRNGPNSRLYHLTALWVNFRCFDLGIICANVVGVLQ